MRYAALVLAACLAACGGGQAGAGAAGKNPAAEPGARADEVARGERGLDGTSQRSRSARGADARPGQRDRGAGRASAPIGPLDLNALEPVSLEEAYRSAVETITAENEESEFEKLKAEIQGGR